ncbi:hypothetical protein LTR59_008246 [Friedmanniomyces endolithicus]|nr:hypothetical protein LTR94_007799 [Friedmanniomyces endolithicus]KAK0793077.1 hypothetical protein LTR59_008246 [Friedmanniomyces endolithicus]KAK0800408.1 hypothetical protein LTR38_007246 [Friedmanniomyces endolithicus]
MASSERSPLLHPHDGHVQYTDHRLSKLQQDEEASSIIKSHVTREEQKMSGTSVGERLPYNDYTTIDWLHDLVERAETTLRAPEADMIRSGQRLVPTPLHTQPQGTAVQDRQPLRRRLWLDSSSNHWDLDSMRGLLGGRGRRYRRSSGFRNAVSQLTAIEATISDYKLGYCTKNPLLNREACCEGKTPLLGATSELGADCKAFHEWSNSFAPSFAIYVAFAMLFGIIASSATMMTKRSLPAASPGTGDKNQFGGPPQPVASGKSMYMAAGSGIPEIKTILSGFVIPNFLDFKVLFVKGFGAIFAVATGMCLGKEGPFVHISTCVGYLVARQFPKYRNNGRKMREMLSAACAAGLSVAFGAPIGGVLFSYEEISTYFPRKVLWRAFVCSLFAAIVLKALNPNGTGKLVLFETHYGTSYRPVHYLIFALLGVAGGIFGGLFCRLNFIWSKWFRSFSIIKNYPVFEVFLVVAATALLQYPNPLTREPGDIIIKNLLVDCRSPASATSWVCQHERPDSTDRGAYVGFLIYGTLTKLVLTIITFGIKVPSGVIIPALDAGSLFGRLVGQWVGGISPGIFAMVGAAAFLAGVSRMTISLCVIMFELTGELEYIVPHMIAIMVAKWVADALGKESVYDLAQAVLGHPFLDAEHAMGLVQKEPALAEELIPPKQTMDEITVQVPSSNKVPRSLLEHKLEQLKERGLMDAGLVLVQNGSMLQGYLAEGELGLSELGQLYGADAEVRLLGDAEEGEFDMSHFVDRTPITVCSKAPIEYVLELFGKLGLRHLMLTEEGTGRLVGVIIKKRLVAYLDNLHD